METAIAEELKKYHRTHYKSDSEQLPKHVGDLINANSFAFLIGAAFDRNMDWKRAWEIPYHINQQGMLDPSRLATAPDYELRTLLHSLPVKPRYPNVGVRTIREAAKLVMEFGGDAALIWQNTSPRIASNRLQRIYGVGPGIAAMAVRLLHEEHGFFQGQGHEIDIKPDVHVMRVFRRAGLIWTERESDALNAARQLAPDFPAGLDWPAWDIGQRWCHKTAPNCTDSPLTWSCPKNI